MIAEVLTWLLRPDMKMIEDFEGLLSSSSVSSSSSSSPQIIPGGGRNLLLKWGVLNAGNVGW